MDPFNKKSRAIFFPSSGTSSGSQGGTAPDLETGKAPLAVPATASHGGTAITSKNYSSTDLGKEAQLNSQSKSVTWQQQNPANNISSNLTQTEQSEKLQPKADKTHDLRRTQTNATIGLQLEGAPASGASADNLKKKVQNENDRISDPKQTDGWRDVYNSYKELDIDWAQKLNDDIGTLLLFAGLFSTVLTAFLVEVYAELQPDNNTKLTAPILVDISKQLHAMSLGQNAIATTVSLTSQARSPILVTTITLWFLSLILSLGAALFGILARQWVREYMRWTTIFPLEHAVHVRHFRKENINHWHVEGAVVIVSMGLVFGLIIFLLGLAILSFSLSSIVAAVATVMVALVLLAVLVTTLMSVFNTSCPYRTPFSSLILILLSYFYLYKSKWKWPGSKTSTLSDDLSKNHDATQKPWCRAILALNKLQANRNALTWAEDIWSNWDIALHLSKEVVDSITIKWKILLELIRHQPVSDSLVVQCFIDLPGPPPPDQEAVNDWLSWKARTKDQILPVQFNYLCRVLFESLRLDPNSEWVKKLMENNYGTLKGEEFQDFLKGHIWQIKRWAPDQGDRRISFDIDVDLASALRSEIQNMDSLSRSSILQCVSWLAKSVLGERQSSYEKIEFDLFSNLLGIYYMLVDSEYPEPGNNGETIYDSYHRTLLNIISSDQPVSRRSTHASNPTLYPSDFQSCIEFAGNLLSFSSSGSHFHGTKIWKFQGKTIVLYIKAAVQFAHRWKLKKPKSSESSSALQEAAVASSGDHKHDRRLALTKVFWALATIVFDTCRLEDLANQKDYQDQVGPFLEAVQQVLDFEVAHSISWEIDDSHDRAEMADFLIMHHGKLPSDFSAVLNNASEKDIINVDEMMAWNGWFISPISDSDTWISTTVEYLDLIKEICSRNITVSETKNS